MLAAALITIVFDLKSNGTKGLVKNNDMASVLRVRIYCIAGNFRTEFIFVRFRTRPLLYYSN